MDLKKKFREIAAFCCILPVIVMVGWLKGGFFAFLAFVMTVASALRIYYIAETLCNIAENEETRNASSG